MKLSQKQSGVLKGMASAMLTSILVILAGITLDPFNYSHISELSERLSMLGRLLRRTPTD